MISRGIKTISEIKVEAIIPIVEIIMEKDKTINALCEWEAPVLRR